MSVANALRKMAVAGLSIEQAADIIEELGQAPSRSSAAERQARYRARRNERDATSDVTSPLAKGAPVPPTKTQNPPKETPLRGSKKGSRPSRRCPEDWVPLPDTLSAMEAEGYTAGEIERALAMVRDWPFKTARSDWDQTLRNWLRKNPPIGQSNVRPLRPAKQSAYLDTLSDIDRAMEQARVNVEQRDRDTRDSFGPAAVG